jgi:MAF protein
MKIILATESPYRKEAFGFLGIPFESEGSNIDESLVKRDNPEKLVLQLAELKSRAVAKNHNDSIIIGMDSVGWFNGKILEKPKSKEDAQLRLKFLSGNKYKFYTGIFMINTASGKFVNRLVETKVFVRKLSEEEIRKYLEEDPGYNTYALGYDPLAHSSSAFNEKIEGSYNNALRVIPLEIIPEMLFGLGR